MYFFFAKSFISFINAKIYEHFFCGLQFLCVLNLLDLLILTIFTGDFFFKISKKAQDINIAWSVCAFLYMYSFDVQIV